MASENLNSRVSFGEIKKMATENKGAFGEALAGIWLKDRLKKNPSLITDQDITDPDPRMWFSHLGPLQSMGQPRCKYGKVNDDGVEEMAWEPDYSFIFTLPDHDIRKEVIIEAKTGDSDLTRDQSEMMHLVAQQENAVVYLCNITLDGSQAELTYEQITDDC